MVVRKMNKQKNKKVLGIVLVSLIVLFLSGNVVLAAFCVDDCTLRRDDGSTEYCYPGTTCSYDGTEYSCNTQERMCGNTEHCSSGTYYEGYACDTENEGTCQYDWNRLDDDYSSDACDCYSGTWTGISGNECCSGSENWIESGTGACSDGEWWECPSLDSSNRFLIEYTDGTGLLQAESTGNFAVKGHIYDEQDSLSPPSNSFRIDYDGEVRAYLTTEGDFYSEGVVSDNMGTGDVPPYDADNLFEVYSESYGYNIFAVSDGGVAFVAEDAGGGCNIP